MENIKSLLKIREIKKSKKPTFLAQDHHKRKEIKKRYRKAKGLQSKIRLNKRGYPKKITKGWKSPLEVRNFHSSGYKVKMINNKDDLKTVDNKIEAGMISSTVGLKKRLQIIDEAIKLKIKILNYKDAEKFASDSKEKIKQAKEKKTKKIQDKKAKEAKKSTKEKKKDSLAEKIKTEEQKKDEEKKKVDKVLTTKSN